MIIAVVGPTGVGKTKLSITLAKKYNGIVVNCDAVQVYKELNIGSAKVTEEEKEGIPHYLFDFVNPNNRYTVYDYQKDLRKIIEENKNKNIILVGGTGLYLKAGLYNYEFQEEKETTDNFEKYTNEELYFLAIKKDENCNIHQNNRKRLIRFLKTEKKTNAQEVKPIYNAIYIGLTTKREDLYQIINKRVEEMFEKGLKEEVETLYKKYKNAPILQSAIGYKEFKSFFNQEKSLEEVKEEIQKNSRHYAKRQYTWFNHQMDINWFNVDYKNFKNTIDRVIEYIEKKKSSV